MVALRPLIMNIMFTKRLSLVTQKNEILSVIVSILTAL